MRAYITARYNVNKLVISCIIFLKLFTGLFDGN